MIKLGRGWASGARTSLLTYWASGARTSLLTFATVESNDLKFGT